MSVEPNDADAATGRSPLTLAVVDAVSPMALAAMSAYFAELDATFSTGFDPGSAWRSDVAAMGPPNGAFLVLVDATDEVAACGGVQQLEAGTAEVKRMWVAPAWRGRGVGARMLSALENRAVELGHDRVVLDTNSSLTPAITMYEHAGYTPIERYNDNPYAQRWFAKELEDVDIVDPSS